MILKIDFHSEIPIYIQLKNQIIQGIAQGDILEGEGLPSVRQLAEDIGINMHTVNKTYNLLKSDGFIKVDRRRGAVVSPEKNNINEEYREQLRQELMPIVAEAHCRGMGEEEFTQICKYIFKEYREGSKHE
jgi:GntR family transcriptional regulator